MTLGRLSFQRDVDLQDKPNEGSKTKWMAVLMGQIDKIFQCKWTETLALSGYLSSQPIIDSDTTIWPFCLSNGDVFFSSTANPIIISNRAPEDHMQTFCLCQARCVRVCWACRLENIMALPWSYGDMGLKSLNSLFWVFYLWLVSGKWEPIVQVLYVVE